MFYVCVFIAIAVVPIWLNTRQLSQAAVLENVPGIKRHDVFSEVMELLENNLPENLTYLRYQICVISCECIHGATGKVSDHHVIQKCWQHRATRYEITTIDIDPLLGNYRNAFAPSANSPLQIAALALRFLLGAPVTRNRVFFLIVRKNLMVRNLDLSLFAKAMYENLQLPQTITWYCPQIRMLFMLSVQSWMHVYPSIVSLTYLAQSFTKARSSPAKGPLGCGRICDYYQEEGEQNASWSM